MITSSRGSRCCAAALAGLTALSLVACGSSTTPGTSVAAGNSSSPSRAPAAKGHATGLVASVSGGTVTLNGPGGDVQTVDVTPSTRVTQSTPGQLTGVTVGECVVARATKDGGTPPTITAASVTYGTAENARCSHPGGANNRVVVGTVASTNGNTLTITAAGGSADTVTITPATRYEARSDATPSVIATGQCLTARGTTDGSGLQAQNVALRPSRDGKCGDDKHQGG